MKMQHTLAAEILVLPKTAQSAKTQKVQGLFEFFGALYIHISGEEMINEASLLFLMQTIDAKSKMIFCCIVWISLEYLQQPEALQQAFFSKELQTFRRVQPFSSLSLSYPIQVLAFLRSKIISSRRRLLLPQLRGRS